MTNVYTRDDQGRRAGLIFHTREGGQIIKLCLMLSSREDKAQRVVVIIGHPTAGKGDIFGGGRLWSYHGLGADGAWEPQRP